MIQKADIQKKSTKECIVELFQLHLFLHTARARTFLSFYSLHQQKNSRTI